MLRGEVQHFGDTRWRANDASRDRNVSIDQLKGRELHRALGHAKNAQYAPWAEVRSLTPTREDHVESSQDQ